MDTPTEPNHPDYRQLKYVSDFLEEWSQKPIEDKYENPADKLFEKLGLDAESVSRFAVDRGMELYEAGISMSLLQILATAWADGFVMGQIYCTQEYPE